MLFSSLLLFSHLLSLSSSLPLLLPLRCFRFLFHDLWSFWWRIFVQLDFRKVACDMQVLSYMLFSWLPSLIPFVLRLNFFLTFSIDRWISLIHPKVPSHPVRLNYLQRHFVSLSALEQGRPQPCNCSHKVLRHITPKKIWVLKVLLGEPNVPWDGTCVLGRIAASSEVGLLW